MLAANIKAYRKQQNLSQKQVADYLGVSTPAVHKWEKGLNAPDISLLAPLARLLKVDLNQLLSFHDVLTQEECNHYVAELAELIRQERYSEFYDQGLALVNRYPTSEWLLLQVGILFGGWAHVFENQQWVQHQSTELLQRVSESEVPEIRATALKTRFQTALSYENFSIAKNILKEIPTPFLDKEELEIQLLQKQGQPAESYPPLEQLLLKRAQEILHLLTHLADNATKENDLKALDRYATCYQKLTELLELPGGAGENLHLQKALATRDKKGTLTSVGRILTGYQEPWQPQRTLLYRHLPGKTAESTKFLQKMLLQALEDEQAVAFIRDEPEFQTLLAEFSVTDPSQD